MCSAGYPCSLFDLMRGCLGAVLINLTITKGKFSFITIWVVHRPSFINYDHVGRRCCKHKESDNRAGWKRAVFKPQTGSEHTWNVGNKPLVHRDRASRCVQVPVYYLKTSDNECSVCLCLCARQAESFNPELSESSPSCERTAPNGFPVNRLWKLRWKTSALTRRHRHSHHNGEPRERT